MAADDGTQLPLGPAETPKSGYIPTLDGWRAVAILFVLLDHSPAFGIGGFTTNRFHYYGNFGVYIFFALSGFLITTRLLDEEKATGGLHLRGFYIRRFMRIQPVAILYLAVVAILSVGRLLPPNWGALLAALLFYRNMVYRGGDPSDWPTGHFWSLSIEEQFYLVLPAVLAFAPRRRGMLLLIAAAGDILWFCFRSEQHRWAEGTYHFSSAMCMHFLILPAAAAVYLRREGVRRFLTRTLHEWWIVPFFLLALPNRSPLRDMLWITPILLVFSTVLHPRRLLGKILEGRPLRYIGRISYSLYIWQMLFLTGYFAPTLHPFGVRLPLWAAWAGAIAAAVTSYHLFEKPLIRLGHRLAHPVTAGHRDLEMVKQS